MINLLADVRKSEIGAARANVIILRYTGIVILAFGFILGALAVSYTLLQSTMASAEAQIAASDVQAGVYSDTKAQVDALSGQLSDASAILSQEVRFSQVLVQLGQIMPKGTVVGDVTLTQSAFNGLPTTLKVYTEAGVDASSVQTTLQNSGIFSSISLAGTEASGGTSSHPAVVTMSVTFNRMAQ